VLRIPLYRGQGNFCAGLPQRGYRHPPQGLSYSDPLTKVRNSRAYNDSLEELKANRDRKIVFILNPPYSGTGEGANKGGDSKKESSKTAVKASMMEKGMGKAANELTVQFLYRIMELVREFHLTDVVVGLFSNPAWLTGDACEAFRKEWLDMFTFDNAFGFRSDEFAGVKPGWAINFSTWRMQ